MLQIDKSECNSHLGIGNAVPSGLREIWRYIRTGIPALESGYTQVLVIISHGSGLCLYCTAHIDIFIEQAQNLGLSE